MNLYDIHAHLADTRIVDDAESILGQAREAGVRGIVVNAARLSEWEDVCALSRHPSVWGALGLHPFFVESWTEDCLERLESMIDKHERVIAVGEIGLDFWEGRDTLDQQLRVLTAQLKLACERDLPVVLHNRKSWNEFFEVLGDGSFDSLRGVCHCFNGSRELARQVLDRGLMVSFCGPLTYANARRIREVAGYIPVDRILSETDTPDLPPRQVKPEQSRPQHVRYIVETLAEIQGHAVADVAEQIETNTSRFLRVDLPPADLEAD